MYIKARVAKDHGKIDTVLTFLVRHLLSNENSVATQQRFFVTGYTGKIFDFHNM